MDDQLEVCAVCLSDMLDDVDNYNEDSDSTIAGINRCSHKFHRYCLVVSFSFHRLCSFIRQPTPLKVIH
jgi:hypothetical protein